MTTTAVNHAIVALTVRMRRRRGVGRSCTVGSSGPPRYHGRDAATAERHSWGCGSLRSGYSWTRWSAGSAGARHRCCPESHSGSGRRTCFAEPPLLCWTYIAVLRRDADRGLAELGSGGSRALATGISRSFRSARRGRPRGHFSRPYAPVGHVEAAGAVLMVGCGINSFEP